MCQLKFLMGDKNSVEYSTHRDIATVLFKTLPCQNTDKGRKYCRKETHTVSKYTTNEEEVRSNVESMVDVEKTKKKQAYACIEKRKHRMRFRILRE